jgi:hypothetical protein
MTARNACSMAGALLDPCTSCPGDYLENRDVLIAELKRNFGEGGSAGKGRRLSMAGRLFVSKCNSK